MNTASLPVSAIIKNKDNLSDPKKSSRDDYRKAKELEEARKAGTVPAEQDEEGRDINPHIPHYIASAPWYIGATGPTLKHQRAPAEKKKEYAKITDWYQKGVNTNSVATKFRKGACENCGAMTHKKKDCLERPRKIGAKFTGEDIAPDEFVNPNIDHDFEGKRDRWNGYDPSEYKQVVEEFSKIEEVKRHLKAEKMLTENAGGQPEEESEDKAQPALDEDNEDKYADDMEMPGTKVDSKQRITVRNLRIREDTAKYLLNLDLSSAYYDPKTRSMREDPLKDAPVITERLFAGENAVRYTGETTRVAKAQLFAWEAYEKGVDIHLQADPTKAELLRKQYEEKKTEFKKNIEQDILAKYGGEEHLEAPPKELLLSQTELFVRYSRRGDIIEGLEKPVIRSKYEEDVLINNHTSVWGSYWENGVWGYKCCHSFVKMSYCTGMAGILARKAEKMESATTKDDEENPERSSRSKSKEQSKEKSVPRDVRSKSREVSQGKSQEPSKKRKRSKSSSSSSSSSSSDSSSSGSSSSSSDSSSDSDSNEEVKRQKKVKAAMKLQEQQDREAERLLAMDERKRPYSSNYEVKKMTDEEMEAYRRRRVHADDPMAKFLDK